MDLQPDAGMETLADRREQSFSWSMDLQPDAGMETFSPRSNFLRVTVHGPSARRGHGNRSSPYTYGLRILSMDLQPDAGMETCKNLPLIGARPRPWTFSPTRAWKQQHGQLLCIFGLSMDLQPDAGMETTSAFFGVSMSGRPWTFSPTRAWKHHLLWLVVRSKRVHGPSARRGHGNPRGQKLPHRGQVHGPSARRGHGNEVSDYCENQYH